MGEQWSSKRVAGFLSSCNRRTAACYRLVFFFWALWGTGRLQLP